MWITYKEQIAFQLEHLVHTSYSSSNSITRFLIINILIYLHIYFLPIVHLYMLQVSNTEPQNIFPSG